jgi:hypothetical protein
VPFIACFLISINFAVPYEIEHALGDLSQHRCENVAQNPLGTCLLRIWARRFRRSDSSFKLRTFDICGREKKRRERDEVDVRGHLRSQLGANDEQMYPVRRTHCRKSTALRGADASNAEHSRNFNPLSTNFFAVGKQRETTPKNCLCRTPSRTKTSQKTAVYPFPSPQNLKHRPPTPTYHGLRN